MVTVRSIMRELDTYMAESDSDSDSAADPIPVAETVATPPRHVPVYDRYLGDALIRAELERHYALHAGSARGYEDDDGEFQHAIQDSDVDDCDDDQMDIVYPTLAELRTRPEVLTEVQKFRWDSWTWDVKMMAANHRTALSPSPSELDYRCMLARTGGRHLEIYLGTLPNE